MTWSPQQESALKAVKTWIRKKDSPVFRLFGYAGTGKTTLALELSRQVKGRVCFAAFTGKAALVMASKGCVGAKTIHSLIYRLDDDNRGAPQFVINHESEVKNAKLVIIDECSMVDETVGRDLMSFAVPILVLGDPEQLPPVKGAGFFTEAPPDILLTEIHRQARDNPILSLATSVREGERIVPGLLGDSIVVRRADLDPARVTGADQVLVGMNRTRTVFNRRFREIRGTLARSPVFPVVDERIICLRNDRSKGLLNGGIWNVEKVLSQEQSGTRMIVSPIDAGTVQQNVQVAVLREFFEGRERDLEWDRRRQSDEFDFAYAITVHKSQGSQWDDVTLFDESAVFSRDARRWLYTGITRAAKRVTVVLN